MNFLQRDNVMIDIVKHLVIFTVAGLLTACSSVFHQDMKGIDTATTDKKKYEHFQLNNGLKVLVISDPDTYQAAASMDVLVGSAHDPLDRQGLAHFLEHMLFLGTKKYPQSGEYQRFIASNGGNLNAYTSHLNTNYFFDIDESKLAGALDRFGQFFISPNFDQQYIDREKKAVHSEFHLGLKDEGRRHLDVIKSIVNPAHPYHKFSSGNLRTLAKRDGVSLRNELIDFYTNYYSASRMSLVVLT